MVGDKANKSSKTDVLKCLDEQQATGYCPDKDDDPPGSLEGCSAQDFNELVQIFSLRIGVRLDTEECFHNMGYLHTGSSAEGDVMTMRLCHGPSYDIDLMKIIGEITHQDIDTEGVHTGFLRIKEVSKGDATETKYIKNTVPFHFSPENIYGGWQVKKPDITVSGPAYKLSGDGWHHDLVTAMKCKDHWPEQAEDWRTRKRISGWPTRMMIDAIIKEGLHVVPVPHPQSENPEYEWRFSFSFAEKYLLNRVGKWAQKCHMVTRYILKEAFHGTDHFKSYHMKTMFLWMLEEYGDEYFTADTIGEMVLFLIEKLILQFSKKSLPSYFIESYNLIDHMSSEDIKRCVEILKSARKNPLQYLMAVMKSSFNPDDHNIHFEKVKTPTKYFQAKNKLNEYILLLREIFYHVEMEIARFIRMMIEPFSYRRQLDILCKIEVLRAQQKGEKWVCPEILKEEYSIKADEYQHFLRPFDLSSIYCALASHLRVRFVQAKAGPAKEHLKKKTSQMFEAAFRAASFKNEKIFAEYVAFLIDLEKLEDAKLMIHEAWEAQNLSLSPEGNSRMEGESVWQYITWLSYKYYLHGVGYNTIQTVYCLLWLEFDLCLKGYRKLTLPAAVKSAVMQNTVRVLNAILDRYEKILELDQIDIGQPIEYIKAFGKEHFQPGSPKPDCVPQLFDERRENARQLYSIIESKASTEEALRFKRKRKRVNWTPLLLGTPS